MLLPIQHPRNHVSIISNDHDHHHQQNSHSQTSLFSRGRIITATTTSRRQPLPFVSSFHQQSHYSSSSTTSDSSSTTTALHHSLLNTNALQLMATTSVTAAVPYAWSVMKLVLVFIAGGLFFSSAMAFCTACYAIGEDNVNHIQAMAKIVWDNIWMTFTQGLSATKAALLADSDRNNSNKDINRISTTNYYNNMNGGFNRWRDAWQVLKQKLRETRQQYVEGVKAMRREANMYAAAVGPPGLILLQYMMDRLMPYSIATALEDSLKASLAQVGMEETDGSTTTGSSSPNAGGVQKATLSHFSAGKQSPKLEAARVYDLGEHAMAFDFDIAWDTTELEATIQVSTAGGLARLPVTLSNAKFHGTVRCILTPLIKESPGFGAALISFPTMPRIGLDIKVAGGEVTKVPRLRAELIGSMERSIADSMIWPKRMVVPSLVGAGTSSEKAILSQAILAALETTDPLLKAEEALGTRPMLRRKLNQMTDLLYEDNAADDILLKSIVNIPMPSFQSNKRSSSNKNKISNSLHTNDNIGKAQAGVLWEELQKTHQHIQEATETQLEGVKSIQTMFWDQLHAMQLHLATSSSSSSSQQQQQNQKETAKSNGTVR